MQQQRIDHHEAVRLLAAGLRDDAFELAPADVAACLPQYEVFARIGRGGMGVVYRARHRQLQRHVALKLLPLAAEGEARRRFAREAQALAQLDHPNIVRIHDVGEDDGLCWIAMDYVDGADLRHYRRHHPDPHDILALLPQLCSALDYVHSQGFVHRDIKPENILIGADGRVRLSDFGLARLMDPATSQTRLTVEGQQLGTPAYMAPEQLERPREVDQRADIYALGVVLYEMLTGELPLGRFEAPSRRARLPRRLDAVILKALAKNPTARQPSAAALLQAVEQASAPRRLWPLVFIGGVVLVAASLVLVDPLHGPPEHAEATRDDQQEFGRLPAHVATDAAQLRDEQFDRLLIDAAPVLRQSVSAADVARVWRNLIRDVGPCQTHHYHSDELVGGNHRWQLRVVCRDGSAQLSLVYDTQQRLAGIWLR